MKKNQIVAFNFGSKNIKIVMGVSKNGYISLDKYKIISTPKEAIFNGAIYQKTKIVEVLKQFAKENKIKKQKIMISISSGETILRTFDFPKMEEKELQGAVKFEMEHLLPEPIENYIIDFTILYEYQEEIQNKEKVSMLKIQTVTLPKKIVMTYLETFQEADLKIDVIDVYSNSILRLLKERENIIKNSSNQELLDKNIALIDLGNQKTTLTIIEHGNVFLNRVIPKGGRNITHIISETLGISMQDAEEWKLDHHYFSTDFNEKVVATLKGYVEDFMIEINGMINYFISRSIPKRLDYIYLIGGGAKSKGICKYFENYMNIPTKLGNDSGNIHVKEKETKISGDLLYLWDVLGIFLRKD